MTACEARIRIDMVIVGVTSSCVDPLVAYDVICLLGLVLVCGCGYMLCIAQSDGRIIHDSSILPTLAHFI